MHGKGQVPVHVSIDFLFSYLNSIWHAKVYGAEDMIKGKMLMNEVFVESPKLERTTIRHWPSPSIGQVALSIDGSFAADGSAGVGMVLRKADGSLIFAAYRHLFFCNDALEEELHEGISLAIKRSELPVVLQSDSSTALSSLSSSTLMDI